MSEVLLVEDSETEALFIRRFLEKAGLAVRSVSNGRQALEAIASKLPDVVLTDLNMPHLDGLELVERIRAQHLYLPVVLMTQYGSEELAVEALQKGAASYVPKHCLERVVIEVLDDVLQAATARRSQAGLRGYLTRTTLHFVLPNDFDLISPLVGRVQQELVEMGFGDDIEVIRMGVALHEALANAIHHGNLDVKSELRHDDDAPYYALIKERLTLSPYRERCVFVETTHSSEEAAFTVRDEGNGFDPAHVPNPIDAENLGKPCGRGLLLIRTFMDEVRHNGQGNEITMLKRRRPDGASTG
jgi:CheY-like chemotaxis protein/anti-sigma regulatory factor (Ser/Thr protein kinase)